jgi:WD40 repeat protein
VGDVMGDELDLRARMRLAVAAALQRAATARHSVGVSLEALLCGAALAPLVAAGAAGDPLMVAGVGVAGSVGANMLTDVVKGAVDRLRDSGREPSQESVEAEVAVRLDKALMARDGSSLREAVAAILRAADVAGAIVEVAGREQNLLAVVRKGFAGLGEQFGEFVPLVDDVRRSVWQMEERALEDYAIRRAQLEQGREQRMLLSQVLEAIEDAGRVPAAASGEAAGVRLWPGNPYPGLMPFEERNARMFFGRQDMVRHLVQRLAEHLGSGGLLLVVGASGAGKSSLLRAGLMPRLAAGALGPGSQRWPRRLMRPADSPLRELAINLAELAGADPISVHRSLREAPGEAPLLAAQAVTAAIAGWAPIPHTATDDASPGPSPRLVLVIDQFEELFSEGENGDGRAEQDAFVAAVHAMASVPAGPAGGAGALVVAAVRADYLDRLIAYPALREAVDAGPFAVGPMSEPELRLAITGPAAEAGLDVEASLPGAVVAELRGSGPDDGLGTGVLPLLSQAMAATWEHREGSELTLRAYRRAGGVADAVNRASQAAYDDLTPGQRDAAHPVFTRLIHAAPGQPLMRRRCRRIDLQGAASQMAADIDVVIETFAARRLLVLEDEYVEISHDVLLHAWKQLRDWLDSGKVDQALYSQLLADAHTWDSNGRDPHYLYQPGRLATIEEALARWTGTHAPYLPLPPSGDSFLRAARRAARRTARVRRTVIASLVVLTLTAGTTAGIAARNASNADRQHAIALSRQLASNGVAIESTDPVTAMQLAVAAWRVFPTDQAASLMTAMLTRLQQRGILPPTRSNFGVNDVAFSPNGRLLAAAYSNGVIRLWNPATGQPTSAPPIASNDGYNNGGVAAVAFSPDSRMLASASTDGTVQLWNPVTAEPIRAPIKAAAAGSSGGVNDVAFSPNGKLLATADGNGTVRLWNPATGKPTSAPLRAEANTIDGGVNKLAFSPNGRLLASVAADGTVRLWNPATGKPAGAPINGDPLGGSVYGIAFSPNGKLLATGDAHGYLRLWNPATGKPSHAPIQVSTGPRDDVTSVAFIPNGRLLAAASGDGMVRLWNRATSKPFGAPIRASAGPIAGVNGIVFSLNGHLLASAGSDGTVHLWNPATGRAPYASLPASSSNGTSSPAFSPDGRLLATAGGNGIVRLWDTATAQYTNISIRAHAGPNGVNLLAFSPNGRLLATAGGNGIVRLWDTATGQLTSPPIRADPGSSGGVNSMAFSPDGRFLATADVNGIVQFWNPVSGLPTRAPLRVDTNPDLTGISDIAFSPDGGLLATAGANGTVRLWNPATGQPAHTPPLIGASLKSGVNSLAFSPDGKKLITAASNGDTQQWTIATGRPTHPLIQVNSSVAGVSFSPGGELLATISDSGNVQLWNPATGQPFGIPLATSSSGMTFDPVRKLLATSSTAGVQIWQVALFKDPYAALCADVGPPTKSEWKTYAPGEPQPTICHIKHSLR